MKYFFIISLFVSANLFAQLKPAGIFTDNMVLQQKKANNIWGTAKPAEKVTVSFEGKKYFAAANIKGDWSVKITPLKAGKAGDIKIETIKEKIILKNILVGEVWLCGGQSNMELTMNFFKQTYKNEIALAKNDNIRFTVIKRKTDNKENTVINLSKKWIAIDSTSIIDCSATAYFYAKKLYEKLQVPIGLVNVAWSGTPAQAWVDEKTLNNFNDYKKMYDSEIKPINFDELPALQKKEEAIFAEQVKNATVVFKNFLQPQYILSEWKKTTVLGGNWETKGYANFDGVAAYRITFNLPESIIDKDAILHLPAIDDEDSTYINGNFIGSSNKWNQQRNYNVSANKLKPGENIITIWVNDTGGGGGFADDANNFYLQLGSNKIVLNDSADFKILAKKSVLSGTITSADIQNRPAVLFNGMIAPLLPYTFAGVIWYQGESNAIKYVEYQTLFPALINNWRNRFSQAVFPFLFVQLSSYNPTKKEPLVSNWAFLREAQTFTLKLPNTGMVVTYDIGDETDIHPKKKMEVGDRFAAAAFKNVYGFKNIIAGGPIFKNATILNDSIKINFSNTGKGLKNSSEKLQGFLIAGEDKIFVAATAEIIGNTVMVSGIKKPMYVRYAWANAPMAANLFNEEGFPAVPFRTDK